MEDLPGRPPPPQQPGSTPPVAGNLIQASEAAESPVTRQEEALTIKFAIGKLNDYLRWFLTVLEITLLLLFILNLIETDPTNLFAGFLYDLTHILLYPLI